MEDFNLSSTPLRKASFSLTREVENHEEAVIPYQLPLLRSQIADFEPSFTSTVSHIRTLPTALSASTKGVQF
ncbi:hypothetical protein V6N11_079720 [Hibiscus sabdariffa]|uniref:Uncharacterized protein n=1 Tax=Hibiscus sabdariffa TaxID=183260 RepID=A0ABR2RW76_9ROSI